MAKIFNDKQIGINAAGRLTAALRAKTRTFADHANGISNRESLKNAKAVPRFKNYGLVRNNTKSTYLRVISIVMPRHGFIRHHGVNITRAGGFRERHKPKNTRYSFRHHMMKQKPEPFIDDIIRRSGVLNYVADKIAESRGEEIAKNIAVSISNFQTDRVL